MLKFSVGVARGFKREDGTDWLSCALFGDRTEKLAVYLVKGTKVLVEGTLRINSYEAKDGTKRYSTEVLVNNVEFIGGKADNEKAETIPLSKGYTETDSSDSGEIPF